MLRVELETRVLSPSLPFYSIPCSPPTSPLIFPPCAGHQDSPNSSPELTDVCRTPSIHSHCTRARPDLLITHACSPSPAAHRAPPPRLPGPLGEPRRRRLSQRRRHPLLHRWVLQIISQPSDPPEIRRLLWQSAWNGTYLLEAATWTTLVKTCLNSFEIMLKLVKCIENDL
jgi:hypothetical protein